ncbi:hypothetical protein EV426DRAFT_606639 [Tirmania nivea]|nr:hypothetical protein EV426DRAFT_606639 [Tirmania nivea]
MPSSSLPPSTTRRHAISHSHPTATAPSAVNFTPAFTSTPLKRKSSSLGRPRNISSDYPSHHPGSKRLHRSATTVTPLIEAELYKSSFQSVTFFHDFIFPKPASTTDSALVRATHADHLLRQLSAHSSSACKSLSQNNLTKSYHCIPPGFSDAVFPYWFCDFANAVAAITTPTPSPIPTWMVTKNHTIAGDQNDRRRPDFALAVGGSFEWRHVLIVGEHQSKGSSVKASFIQLACYVEQVFIAQPFRTAVLGILTSRSGPRFTLWRFDRAGALGSHEVSYSSAAGLQLLILCLDSMTTLPLELGGFHTSSISWARDIYPLDAHSSISTHIPPEYPSTANDAIVSGNTVHYRQLVFGAKGIVSRGTRVWIGVMRNIASGEEVDVAIKESWRSIGRDSEAELYRMAAARGVQGLPTLLHHATYEDIKDGVRQGHIPVANNDPEEYSAAYAQHIAAHNRVFSRLILGQTGIPIDSSVLSPLAIARALLAAAIGHASLFFQGNILHRDLSPYNILASPSATPLSTTQGIPGIYGRQTELYGSLIDLDYALDKEKCGASSGAKDRTGTFPFIAINILLGLESHRYRHDLESLLYVLLFVSLYPRHDASSNSLTKPSITDTLWDQQDPLKLWFTASESVVADHKKSRIVLDAMAFESLLADFRPGFQSFKNTARRIRLTLWRASSQIEACQLVYEKSTVSATTTAPAAAAANLTRASTKKGLQSPQSHPHARLRKPKPNPVPSHTKKRKKTRSWLYEDEMRIGVSNWQAYLEVLDALEELVNELSRLDGRSNGSESEESWETGDTDQETDDEN